MSQRTLCVPCTFSVALIGCLLVPITAIAQDLPKPSPSVKRILDKAASDVEGNRQEFEKCNDKNRRAFDEANKKPLTEARNELEELAKQLIDDGKTDEATAVLNQVKTLDADVLRIAKVPVSDEGRGRAALHKPLLQRMAGKWDNPNDSLVRTIDSKGRLVEIRKKDGGIQTQGQLQQQGDHLAVAQLANGWTIDCLLAADGETMACVFRNPAGKEQGCGAVLRKVP
jgi:hypothetical protein